MVGCHAHFNNEFKKTWDDMPGFADECKELSECPSEAIPMERTFVALTIICLILSTFSLVAGFVMDVKKFKAPVGVQFLNYEFLAKFYNTLVHFHSKEGL